MTQEAGMYKIHWPSGKVYIEHTGCHVIRISEHIRNNR